MDDIERKFMIKLKNDWRKKNIKQFNVDLNIPIYNELNELLKLYNMTKVDFIKYSIYKFKEEKKFKKYYVKYESVKKYSRQKNISNITCEKVFNTIEEATDYYNSIKLPEDSENNNKYTNYKFLYEIEEKDYNQETNNVNLETAYIIRQDFK